MARWLDKHIWYIIYALQNVYIHSYIIYWCQKKEVCNVELHVTFPALPGVLQKK